MRIEFKNGSAIDTIESWINDEDEKEDALEEVTKNED